MEPRRVDSRDLLPAGGLMDTWSSSSSLILSDSCDILSSTLAVSGSVSTFAIAGTGIGGDERAEAGGVRSDAGSRSSVQGQYHSGITLLRPHRNLSITLSDPDRLQPETMERTRSVLQLPNRRASSLRDHFRRRQALTVEDTDHDYLSNLSSTAAAHKRRGTKSPSKTAALRLSTSKSDNSRCGTSHDSRRDTVSSNSSDGSDLFVSSDLCMRGDLLVSPRVSPLLWLKQCVPALVVSASNEDSVCGRLAAASNDDDMEARKLLDVPTRTEFRRNSSISGQSTASEDNDGQLSPSLPRRGRRQAIFDSKSLGLDGMDLSPTTSCDESDISSQVNSDRVRRRRRSSVDLEEIMASDVRRKGTSVRPLLKRNTIADFANTQAYQESTASLILVSADQDKRLKSAFSLLKLIDKKYHRCSKDNVVELSEVLKNLKASEFKDTRLAGYKNSHWIDLVTYDNAADDEAVLSNITETERKRREAVWELFHSECVFLIDHLMVLKHCFMEPLKKVQVEGHLMFAEPDDLFGNLDELCYVSYTFSRDFISLLLKDVRASDFGRTQVLIKALRRFCQLTRDGEVYHDYCLNYSKATTYLEQLRKNEDFNEFEKWCCQDERCHRLQLADLLISPMQHCTKVPLLLNNIRKHTAEVKEQQMLTEALSKLETSLVNLEAKMVWLKNFERVQEIQQQIIWLPVTELEPRAFIPEFLRGTLSRQPCERLLSSTQRRLLFEGPVSLLEISKAIAMYMFLFDDILLLTRIKKAARKGVQKANTSDPSNPYMAARRQTEGAVFVVHKQPMALDRITVHDVRPSSSSGIVWDYVENASETHTSEDSDIYKDWCLPHIVHVDCSPSGQRGSSLLFGCVTASSVLKNAFVLVQVNRFQQIIEVYTLQAPSYGSKASWLIRLHEAQENYKNACRQTKTNVETKEGDIEKGSDVSPLASPVNEPQVSLTTSTSPASKLAHSRRSRMPVPEQKDKEIEEGEEEEKKAAAAAVETMASRRPTRRIYKNRSSSSDAMVEIVGMDEEISRPRTSLSSSTSRRISDPLRCPLATGDPSLGPNGVGSEVSSSASVFSGPTTHVVVVTVHAEQSPGSPFPSAIHKIGHSGDEGEDDAASRPWSQPQPHRPRENGAEEVPPPSFRSRFPHKPYRHHSSLKIRERRGAMRVIQEKSHSVDAIQL